MRALRNRIDWLRFWFTGGIPIIAIIIGSLWVPLHPRTAIFTTLYATCSGISFTASKAEACNLTSRHILTINIGYHRLWAHRAYSVNNFLKIVLAITGASAGQASIRTWCRDHRAHHRYTDTDRDPYSAHKGLFYSHYRSVVIRRRPEQTGRVDLHDLSDDPVVT